jgi:hypothetical protein
LLTCCKNCTIVKPTMLTQPRVLWRFEHVAVSGLASMYPPLWLERHATAIMNIGAQHAYSFADRPARGHEVLRRCVRFTDLHTGVAHLHRERAQQVATACAVAGFARLLQRRGC